MINIEELRLQLDEAFALDNNEDDILNYVMLVVREDVIKIINDIINIAQEDSTTDNLYHMFVHSIIDESSANLEEVVHLFNSYGPKRELENITIDVVPSYNGDWAGPSVTPIFKD
jgi:hypothetical protein